MSAPVRVAEPLAEPVSLPEAKAHLRVDHDDDALIAGMVSAAVAHFDGWSGILGRALEEQTWQLALDRFPAGRSLRLTLGPVVSVESIRYDDKDGTEQTLDLGVYQLNAGPVEARIALAPAASWPATGDRINAVRVRWLAGTRAPASVRQAILLLVGHWYAHREAAGAELAELPLGVAALIAPWRRVGI